MEFFGRIKKIPAEYTYTILLFFITRTFLTIIGVMSRLVISPYFVNADRQLCSRHAWLDIWGQWDTGWYISVARFWYGKDVIINRACNYGFFPLYPLLMKIAAFFTRNYFLAGLLVSNAAFLAACVLLVKLVRLDYGEKIGLDTLKIAFFFPTAFILSGVFMESLYLALALGCFYCAKKERWALAGVCGFFLALTRPEGFLITLPLLYLYLAQRGFSLRSLRPHVLFLLLPFLGVVTFAAYTHYRMGDWFAYIHANKYWDYEIMNPFVNIANALFNCHVPAFAFGAVFFLAAVLIVTGCFRQIGFAYWFFGAYTLVLPVIFNRPPIFCSIPRYALLAFPLFIALAILSQRKYLRSAIMVSLILLQGFLMVFWANCMRLVV